MRYKIILFAILSFSMFGCSKTESIVEPEKKLISFETTIGKQTKYIIDGESYPLDMNFSIWSFLKAQGASDYDYINPFMNDCEIRWYKNQWVTKNGYYYWPVYAKLKFVAYSPWFIAIPTYDATNGLKFTDVTPYSGNDTTGYDDIDFMYVEDDYAVDKTIADAPVSLLFKHALTQVRFTATAPMTDVTFKIKELKIGEIKDAGTFQTLPIPQWSDLKNKNTTLNWFIMFKGDMTLNAVEQQVGFSVLYIPQPIDGMEVKVTYEVTFNGVTKLITKTIVLSGQPWEMNQKIKYALTFSLNNEITFYPTINDWTTGTAIPVAN